MTTADLKLAALVLIDVQCGFDDAYWGERNNPQAEQNIARLLQDWRTACRPVIHVKHMSTEDNSPLRPEKPGNAFKPEASPLDTEPVFEKTVNSAFIGTRLEEHLQEHQIESLVIAGLTTDHCVSTSTRMAGNLGFRAYLVADACATFQRQGHDGKIYPAEEVHQVALASLHQEFATVLTTDAILALLK